MTSRGGTYIIQMQKKSMQIASPEGKREILFLIERLTIRSSFPKNTMPAHTLK